MRLLALIFALFIFSPVSWAEVVEFESGRVIQAKIIEVGDDFIQVDIQGVGITYYFDEIKTINGFLPEEAFCQLKREPLPSDLDKSKEDISGLKLSRDYFESAIDHFNKGDFSRAIDSYNRVLEINPKSAAAYSGRGNVYLNKGNPNQAISDFNQALKIDSAYDAAYYNRGAAYTHKGNLPQAINDYNQALEISPDLAQAYVARAIVYFEKGDYSLARQDVDKAESLGYPVPFELLQGLNEVTAENTH